MSDQNFIPLSGYTDRLSARPGNKVEVRVSSLSLEPYQACLVRVRYADPNPEGQGIKLEEVPTDWEGSYPSREQKFYPGSYGMVERTGSLSGMQSFSVLVTLWPTRPGFGRQTLLAHQEQNRGWSLFLDENLPTD